MFKCIFNIKRFTFLIFFVFIASCGGKTESNNNSVLSSSVGSLSNKILTVGDPTSFSGGRKLAQNSSFRILLAKISNFFIAPALAEPIGSCSTSANNLIGTTDQATWNIIGLTSSPNSSACVSRIQDAGRYLVMSVNGLTDGSGKKCDLVTINKSTGQTSCINLSLPNRSVTGDPDFYLGLTNFFPAELTLNGNFFTIGFFTKDHPNAYVGFLRIDLSGDIPTSFIEYMEYGAATSTYGVTTVNNHNIFWGEYWPLENGDLIFTSFDIAVGLTDPVTGYQSGTASHYYIVANPNLSDPTKAMAVLFDKSVISTTNVPYPTYYSDVENSPVAIWFKGNYTDASAIYYDNEVMPNPSSSLTEHSFFIKLGNYSDLARTICSGPFSIIKGTVDVSNGNISFENYGPSGIGNGWGTHTRTSNITIDGNTDNWHDLKWRVDSANTSQIEVYTTRRNMTPNSCDSVPMVIYTGPLPSGTPVTYDGRGTIVTGTGDAPYTYETATSIFMQSFNSNPGDPNTYCAQNNGLGCSIGSYGLVLVYDKASGSVNSIPLSPLSNSNYAINSEMSSITSSRVYVTATDMASLPVRNIYAELTLTGFKNVIELPAGINFSQFMVSGN
jgi:hypothetical protein